MDPYYSARLALARLPRPYTDEVILHVFCEIERTPPPWSNSMSGTLVRS